MVKLSRRDINSRIEDILIYQETSPAEFEKIQTYLEKRPYSSIKDLTEAGFEKIVYQAGKSLAVIREYFGIDSPRRKKEISRKNSPATTLTKESAKRERVMEENYVEPSEHIDQRHTEYRKIIEPMILSILREHYPDKTISTAQKITNREFTTTKINNTIEIRKKIGPDIVMTSMDSAEISISLEEALEKNEFANIQLDSERMTDFRSVESLIDYLVLELIMQKNEQNKNKTLSA